MNNVWTNWSGSLKFSPANYCIPESEEELIDLVSSASRAGRKIRVVGAGHSSSPLVETSDTLISLIKLKGLVSHGNNLATFRPGTTVNEANTLLKEIDKALFNTGDIDVQMLAGAIATGTHGSGRSLQNLSSILSEVRVISPEGKVHNYKESTDPGLMRALRVSLGTLGIFSEISVRTVPLFKLHRREICTTTENAMRYFDDLSQENRNVDFYWYPRRDDVKIRILNEPGSGSAKFPFQYHIHEEAEGYVGDVLPKSRELKFDEMEFALPYDAGMKCFESIRERIIKKHRKEVAWRVLYRVIASDDNFLSPHHGRLSVSISLHHNAGLPYANFFSDVEPIFRDFGGRPHWGKKHSMTASELGNLYPQWEMFKNIRKAFDPNGIFMTDYLKQILGE